MIDHTGPGIRARRQERVAKVVWGTLFVVMGVLFTLHDMGRINLGEPRNGLVPEHAVDGDDKTRWGSSFHDKQWLMVDLGASVPLSKVRLNWESAYAKDYELQVSNDGLLWNTVRRVTGGDGGVEEQEIGQTARYVRVLGLRRATPYGISLYELQVFDSDGQLISQGKRATASSVEDQVAFALWFKFWPLLLVAGGLPLLLAPRNDANQVFGLVLTAMGSFLELQSLEMVPWGARQTSAVVLILVGVVILLQSQRRSEESGTGSSGDSL
jgi:F5/8 type C domain-containing protein/cell wall-active antibiotic response 4TMS protein YvqF